MTNDQQYLDDLSGNANGSGASATEATKKANEALSEAASKARHIKLAVWSALAVLACLAVTMMYVVCNFVHIVESQRLTKHVSVSAAPAQPATSGATASSAAPTKQSAATSAGTASMPAAKASSESPPSTDLSIVAASFTMMTSALVIALTVLSIGLVRMAFQFASDRPSADKDDSKSGGATQLPAADMAKHVVQTLAEALSTVAKGIPGGKG